MRRPLPLALAVVVAALAGRPAAGGDAPDAAAAARATEVKALLALLRQAEHERFARQAWYLAWRITRAEPTQKDALDSLGAHPPDSLTPDDVLAPAKPFAQKRDAALAAVGDAYAQAARAALAAGKKPVDVEPLLERALAYGSKAADLATAVGDAGTSWAGTWGTPRSDAFETALGAGKGAVTFPPEWDDAYLSVRPRWTNAKILEVGGYRIVSEDAFPAAARRALLLSALDAYAGSLFPASPRGRDEPIEPTDVFVVPTADLYSALGLAWKADGGLASRRGRGGGADEELKKRFAESSGWEWTRRPHRVLVLERDRHNPWVGDDATFLFHVGRTAARLHAGGAGARISGRGAWILDGYGGLFEGFVPKGPFGGDVDPAKAWRLQAAKALHASKSLLPWDQFYDLDRAAQDATAHVEVSMRFGGKEQKAVEVDPVAAQATALVWGLLHADGGKQAKKVGPLLSEAIARDRLPDVDKAMGWAKGRAAKEAEKALDDLPSP